MDSLSAAGAQGTVTIGVETDDDDDDKEGSDTISGTAVSITGSGTSNNITWKRAIGDAKKPKVSVTGLDNKVSKAK